MILITKVKEYFHEFYILQLFDDSVVSSQRNGVSSFYNLHFESPCSCYFCFALNFMEYL